MEEDKIFFLKKIKIRLKGTTNEIEAEPDPRRPNYYWYWEGSEYKCELGIKMFEFYELVEPIEEDKEK